MLENILAVGLMSMGMSLSSVKDEPKQVLRDTQITDLTNYQWVADNALGLTTETYNINFSSNETNYTELQFTISSNGNAYMYYGETQVYVYNDNAESITWTAEAYKTIQINGGEDVTNTDLITFLQENGTLTYVEPPQEPNMGNDIIGSIASGLGIISALATTFLTGFGNLFYSAGNLTPFAIFSLVMLGIAVSFAVVKLVLSLIRSNTGA